MKLFSTLVMLTALLSGCTYTSKTDSLGLSPAPIPRNSKTVTLIDNRAALPNQPIGWGQITLNLDVREAFFDAAKTMLGDTFKQVKVSPAPADTDYFAIANYSIVTDGGPAKLVLDDSVKMEIFDTSTKKSVGIFDYKNTSEVQNWVGANLLAGATLCITCPILFPIELNSHGKTTEAAITKDLRTGLMDIKSQIASKL